VYCYLACSETKLKAVKIEKGDVDVLASEFDLARPLVERQLRLAGGNVQEAMRRLMGVMVPRQEAAAR
jgi:hypothetical protein